MSLDKPKKWEWEEFKNIRDPKNVQDIAISLNMTDRFEAINDDPNEFLKVAFELMFKANQPYVEWLEKELEQTSNHYNTVISNCEWNHAGLDLKVLELKKAIELLGAMAGNPDAKEGCRLIVRKAREILVNYPEKQDSSI